MTTLVIDDDPFALKLLGRQLELLGCDELTLCGGAQEAIVLLEQQGHLISLVFCDLQMPDLDGVEFVRHLARIGYRGGLVLVSGEDERVLLTVQKLAQAHRMQVLGALQKPVSPAQLRHILDNKPSRPALVPVVPASAYGAEELARAIAAGELVNHYQPKVDLATGALVGVEALVRWQHPIAGLVYPDRFISTAESHGLIDELTRAVLVNALRQSRAWQQEGLPLQMAVNVSMDNLAALDFPDVVARLAAQAGVALSNLTLEVTESRLMGDSRASLEILTRLRLKRITLSIDDFGTGHSSLAQLRDIPFDELKLDRGFIDGVSKDAALRAIVEATLAMARQLGIKSVAEGVEDRADWDLLRRLGCDVAQGYLISRPMPGNAVPGWRADWEPRRPGLMVTAS
jgi:EAL domain-containing protein (putative c-di-GMP-specific phosphodiesterase class I)/DNA-binding NarL/FixJ family response regulator